MTEQWYQQKAIPDMILRLERIKILAPLTKHYEYEACDMQEILVNVVAEIDDKDYHTLEEVLDYAALENDIVSLIKSSKFSVIEQIANATADLVLKHRLVKKATAEVVKNEVTPCCATASISITKTAHKVFLALGGNIGDREVNIKNGIKGLSEFVSIAKISSIREYEALLLEGTRKTLDPPYLNCVLYGYTALLPSELLVACQALEQQKQTQKWASRGLDIDIIWYDDKIVANKSLKIPHPEFTKRDFVVDLMQEIAPEMFLKV